MDADERKVQDPVCNMMVDPDQLAVAHLGMHFAFCSEQCRQRFLNNPDLYIVEPEIFICDI